MSRIIHSINELIWGPPLLILILGVGIYLSVRLWFPQIKLFPTALKAFLGQLRPGTESEDRSSFRALCTALAATVGTGNLVGVAGAICLGGPGAVFWMWICGIFGMVTKYTEALLAVRYRIRTEEGYAGGPMHIITQALPRCFHPLAGCYAVFGIFAAFGVGNAAQINAAVSGIRECFRSFGRAMSPLESLLLTILMAGVITLLLSGGARSIASAAEVLVPFGAAGYILLCVGVLLLRWYYLPDAFMSIIQGAFAPRAVTGGIIGASLQSLRIGCSRGVFTNEAGMGTASIAHAEALGVKPAQQGLMGIMEVFLDTIVICTLTALVILVSGVPIPYGTDIGGVLTAHAFSVIYGRFAVVFLTAVMTLFALATVLGWGLYGSRCMQFLFGRKACRLFILLQIPAVFAGAFLETASIWQLSEVFNGLMAIPNLITLAMLAPEAARLTKEYKNQADLPPVEVNYANFHQCKPL